MEFGVFQGQNQHLMLNLEQKLFILMESIKTHIQVQVTLVSILLLQQVQCLNVKLFMIHFVDWMIQLRTA